MFVETKKQERSTYVPALERALYDLYVSLGDQDDDIANGGSFRGWHYEPLELPLSVAAARTGFRLQSGMGYERLRQLDADGIYRWRRNGPGKPSFLSLVVWDHDEHFAALKNSRLQNYITRRDADAALPKLQAAFIEKLNASGTDDVQRYAYLAEQFGNNGRTDQITPYWNAYKQQRKQYQ